MRARVVAAILVISTAAATAAHQFPRLEPQATGTGAIRGRVVDAGTGAPVAGARLWLSQTRGDTARGVYPRSEQSTSDFAGRFEFATLPAGQFSIDASATGYISGALGKRRPEGEPAWATLKDGQTFADATIELFRGGSISGVVINDRGEPMRGVHVETWLRTTNGTLKNHSGGETNAVGAYRISNVPAGDHLVVARVWHYSMRQGPPNPAPSPCSPPPPPPPLGLSIQPKIIEKPSRAEGEWFSELPRWIPQPGPDDRGQLRTIATTMYTSVSDVSLASAVIIGGGEERAGVHLRLAPVATTTVQGHVVPLPGRKIGKGSEVRLRLPGAPADLEEHTTWVQPDHTFRFVHVPAGSYELELQIQEAVSCDVITRNSEDVLTQMPLDVPPAGLEDVAVFVANGVAMTGRILFEGKAPSPGSGLMDIWLSPASGGEAKFGGWDDSTQISAGGLTPGRYALRVSQNGKERWFVKSMMLGRLDLATRPLDVARDDLPGVEVTMTDRPSALEGAVVNANGGAVRDATVVVFPVDRNTWTSAQDGLAGFARTRSLDGTYRFDHVLPGDYFVAAVDERRMGNWPRREFLESLAKQAAPLRIAVGVSQTLTLKVQ